MTSYIGTSTSRVDGCAKVTGGAQYAGEFEAPNLVYASVVTSTIARGRIARIDTSRALAVESVMDVLTHENRPKMASTDEAYNDECLPGGSPFRPLYDDKIKFNNQPIALVLAEESEIARFAATLVHIDYDAEEHTTDLHTQIEKAYVVDKPDKPRGNAAKAYAAAAVRHEGEYFIPIEHHNPMELFAATVIWNGDGKLTVFDKTQGVQNVQRYVCGVFGLNPDNVRVLSPFVGGAFGSGLRPQYEVVLAVQGALQLQRSIQLVLTRAQMSV
jgi:xanthine dehydrogenase YagR molybdenum-binding subunit